MFINVSSHDTDNSRNSSVRSDNNLVGYPSRTVVHPKLEMTEPGDADEREADLAAHDVMSGKVFRKFSGGGAGGGMAVSSQMESQLNQLQGGGQAMPDGLRGMMERGFDRDFSQVRLHTDGEAAGLSGSIHAKAFTHGNDIYFNQGQYAPETSEGQRLVAHELAHVAQGGGKVGRISFGDNLCSQMGKVAIAYSNMQRYIKEPDWIKTSVLGDALFNQLVMNYYIDANEEKKPVTIVVFCSQQAACHVEDTASIDSSKPCAFEEYGAGPIRTLLMNSQHERVLMIQAPQDAADLKGKINSIRTTYGTIKDVVFRGHGNSNILMLTNTFYISTLGNSITEYDSILETIADGMTELDPNQSQQNLPHALILDGCLTASDAREDKGLSAHAEAFMKNQYNSLGVNVIGNESSVTTYSQSLGYNGRNLSLSNDTLIHAPKSTQGMYNFQQCEPTGELRNLIGKLDSSVRNKYEAPDDFDHYCLAYESGESVEIKMEKDVNGVKQYVTLEFKTIVDFVKAELRLHPERRSVLCEFLRMIDDSDSALFDRFQTYKTLTGEFNIWEVYARTFGFSNRIIPQPVVTPSHLWFH